MRKSAVLDRFSSEFGAIIGGFGSLFALVGSDERLIGATGSF